MIVRSKVSSPEMKMGGPKVVQKSSSLRFYSPVFGTFSLRYVTFTHDRPLLT